MRGRVKWTERSVPYRQPGFGIALLTFCVWVMIALAKACVVIAKWTVVVVMTVVAAIVGWVGQHRQRS